MNIEEFKAWLRLQGFNVNTDDAEYTYEDDSRVVIYFGCCRAILFYDVAHDPYATCTIDFIKRSRWDYSDGNTIHPSLGTITRGAVIVDRGILLEMKKFLETAELPF